MVPLIRPAVFRAGLIYRSPVALRNDIANFPDCHVTLPQPETVKSTLSDRTFEQLRDLIVRGRIGAGSRVVEAEVALRFGVSRTPVREAIARLILEGFVTPVAGGLRTEVVVSSLSADGVRELWPMIGALESCAICRIAKLHSADRIRLVEDLERLNLELKAEAETRPRDPDRLYALQTEFHTRFVNETAGPHLRRVYEALRPQVQRYEWAYGTRLDAQYEPSTKEHIRIISAIRFGDASAASAALLNHWSRAAERTIATMESIDAKPGPRRKPRK